MEFMGAQELGHRHRGKIISTKIIKQLIQFLKT